MLDELLVRNLALIEEAHICPGRGLVVVSGETGTGKTLLLGALRLLLGAESRPDLVGPFGDETVVEGRFVFDGEEVVVARRLPREGRSRAYLNGSLASGKALAERLGAMVEIIGQHDQMALTRPNEVRALVDSQLDSGGVAAKAAYEQARATLRQLNEARDALGGDVRALTRELDLTRFQAGEIEAASFGPGDDQTLERRAARLRHAESLVAHLGVASEGGEVAAESIGSIVEELRRASRLDPELAALTGEAEAMAEALTELARSVRLASEGITADPGELAGVEARLTLLGELRRKYGPTLDDILAFGVEARRRSGELTGLLERADSIDTEYEAAAAVTATRGRELADARRRAGEALADRALVHLTELGMADPVIRVEVTEDEPGPQGADRMRLLFSSDARLQPGDVARVASGGELSRLILSL
ncbi:MAG: hypothetical protein Q8Q52_01410, partial [Acidimicrobiia bacterium]|nr:hypothetical protein [Acidimicrobiia bacterium]